MSMYMVKIIIKFVNNRISIAILNPFLRLLL